MTLQEKFEFVIKILSDEILQAEEDRANAMDEEPHKDRIRKLTRSVAYVGDMMRTGR